LAWTRDGYGRVTMDVYIIRKGSPESRLLSHVGFDRDTLQVAEWRGRRRSKGGYGKAPVAWRISGESDVRKLCNGVVRILGSRPIGQLTPADKKALDRAQRTLAAFENRARRSSLAELAQENRESVVRECLRARFPCASDADLLAIMSVLERDTPRSVDDLLSTAGDTLAGRVSAWNMARNEFIDTIRRANVDL
jgi:hypothetical protein